MTKVIRLNESQLVGLVKKIIKEQSQSFEKLIDNWGKKIMKKLGTDFYISFFERDRHGYLGTHYQCSLNNIRYAWSLQSDTAKNISDIKEIRCLFDAYFYDDYGKKKKCKINIVFGLSNGILRGITDDPFFQEEGSEGFFIRGEFKKIIEKKFMGKLANDKTLIDFPSSEPDVKIFKDYMIQKGYKLTGENAKQINFIKKTKDFTSSVELNNTPNSSSFSSSGQNTTGKSILICVQKISECDILFKNIPFNMELFKKTIASY